MKKISVITINFNNGNELMETIASVAAQNLEYIEYIVIDGGSTDSSVDIINRYSQKIDYWVSEKDRGIYHAMNKGIEKSSGEYLIFLNSGDIFLSPNSLKDLTTPFPEKDLVYGDLLIENDASSKKKSYPDTLQLSDFYVNSLPHPATLIKKSLFDKIGPYDENLKIAADWKFFLISIFKENASYEHREVLVTKFNLKGISSKPSNQSIAKMEKEQTLNGAFPRLAKDIIELQRLRRLERKAKKNLISRILLKKYLKI
ncbi:MULTISPECIES: glycosyltransferase family 2 protein [Spongiibacter]|uniref:glycosyltransferase family 2 protein n=1 Tax=Spongiibacter TaxID=630749 RepID=UPI000C3B763B|nr:MULTISPECIES: glycosyltransferase family 2 protein [Spongiibacter]MAY39914.1 glycosyl transferase [Spongiibacter sp.]MBI58055.1 glycosyl transferase [Spongiibacter sp.]|tara:strand:+ start:156 stop:929 length:774 start_codon:yes stop_codon:yes gene_type:complete